MAENNVFNNEEVAVTPETPTTENDTSRKGPEFVGDRKTGNPSQNGADGEQKPSEQSAERGIPKFKSGGGGINGIPGRDYLASRKKHEVPIFAADVKQHEDFDDNAEEDFTSDSIAMPIVNADASDFVEDNKKNSKREKPKDFFKEDEEDEKLAKEQNMSDELLMLGGTVPTAVPFGNAYPDFDSAPNPYVPTYEEENRLMERHAAEGLSSSQAEPLPEYDPFVPETKQRTRGQPTDETELLNSYDKQLEKEARKAEKKQQKKAAKAEANQQSSEEETESEPYVPYANEKAKREAHKERVAELKAQAEEEKQQKKAAKAAEKQKDGEEETESVPYVPYANEKAKREAHKARVAELKAQAAEEKQQKKAAKAEEKKKASENESASDAALLL